MQTWRRTKRIINTTRRRVSRPHDNDYIISKDIEKKKSHWIRSNYYFYPVFDLDFFTLCGSGHLHGFNDSNSSFVYVRSIEVLFCRLRIVQWKKNWIIAIPNFHFFGVGKKFIAVFWGFHRPDINSFIRCYTPVVISSFFVFDCSKCILYSVRMGWIFCILNWQTLNIYTFFFH